MDHDDLDEDIERLKIVLQDEENDDGGESDGELRVLENNGIAVWCILNHICVNFSKTSYATEFIPCRKSLL